jgi:hypothetical protein
MPPRKFTLPLLLVLNLLVKGFVALRPLKYIDGMTLPDDAYVCLTLAKNIAKGLGPLYGADYTNGFQPLYVFLTAPLYWIFPNNLIAPVHAALILLIIFDTATLYLLYRLINRESLSPITPILMAVAWILSPYSIRIAVNGMETAIAMFFIVAALFILRGMILKGDYSAKALIGLGIVLGLGVMARIDIAFLFVSFAIYLTFSCAKEKIRPLSRIGRLAIMAAAALAAYMPYMIYQFHYTGDLIPVSGSAVRLMTLAEGLSKYSLVKWHSMMLTIAAITALRYNSIYIILTTILGLMLWRRNGSFALIKKRFAVANPLLPFCIMIFAAYAFYIMGPWFYHRYLYPISLLFLIYLAVMLDSYIAALLSSSARKIIAAAFIIIIAITTAARPSYRLLFFSTDTEATGYMNFGLWARDHFPDSTVVGSSQTGALGYFAPNLKVVNLDGVVNRKCLEALKAKRNMEYIREAGIEYVIGWGLNIDFIKWQTENFKPDDLIFVEKVESLQSLRTDWLVYKVNYGERENAPEKTP